MSLLLSLCNYSVPVFFCPVVFPIPCFPIYNLPFCYFFTPSCLLTLSSPVSVYALSSQIWSKAGCTGLTRSFTCSAASTWTETTGRKYSSLRNTWLIPSLSLCLRYCCCSHTQDLHNIYIFKKRCPYELVGLKWACVIPLIGFLHLNPVSVVSW